MVLKDYKFTCGGVVASILTLTAIDFAEAHLKEARRKDISKCQWLGHNITAGLLHIPVIGLITGLVLGILSAIMHCPCRNRPPQRPLLNDRVVPVNANSITTHPPSHASHAHANPSPLPGWPLSSQIREKEHVGKELAKFLGESRPGDVLHVVGLTPTGTNPKLSFEVPADVAATILQPASTPPATASSSQQPPHLPQPIPTLASLMLFSSIPGASPHSLLPAPTPASFAPVAPTVAPRTPTPEATSSPTSESDKKGQVDQRMLTPDEMQNEVEKIRSDMQGEYDSFLSILIQYAHILDYMTLKKNLESFEYFENASAKILEKYPAVFEHSRHVKFHVISDDMKVKLEDAIRKRLDILVLEELRDELEIIEKRMGLDWDKEKNVPLKEDLTFVFENEFGVSEGISSKNNLIKKMTRGVMYPEGFLKCFSDIIDIIVRNRRNVYKPKFFSEKPLLGNIYEKLRDDMYKCRVKLGENEFKLIDLKNIIQSHLSEAIANGRN